MEYRPYQPTDFDTCLTIFRTNIPRYFRDHEESEFKKFLQSPDGPYYVISLENDDVACGGYCVPDGSDTAILCWGMVNNEYHGKRLGEYLLQVRLHLIANTSSAKSVRLATCQLTAGFFQRYGFKMKTTQPDGIAPGLDDVGMILELTDEIRTDLKRLANKAD